MGPRYRGEKKSGLDEMREQLDSLMGINRNNDREKDQVKDYKDERVCKFYIASMCPYDLFTNTKMDRGPCTRIHSKELKAAYEEDLSKNLIDKSYFDPIIEKEFQQRIQEIDRVIKRNQQKYESSYEETSLDKRSLEEDPETNTTLLEINDKISSLIQQSEEKFFAEDYDGAQDIIMNKIEECIKEKNNLITKLNENLKRTGVDKKLRCCDVCGSLLAMLESDKRLSDHFLGKQHVGFQYMRDALEVIRKRKEERKQRYRENSRERPRRREDSRDRDRGRNYRRDSRDRSRDRNIRRYNRRSNSRG